MRIGIAPLLERHRVFHSRDPEETLAFLHRVGFRFEAASRRSEASPDGVSREPGSLDLHYDRFG